MATYHVLWEVDIEASTPEEAARECYEIMLDPASIPPYFDVVDQETGIRVGVDVERLLSEED